MDQLKAFLASHGIVLSSLASAFLGAGIKHYWPQAKAWITGEGTDEAVARSLQILKLALRKHGATDTDVMNAESFVAQITARVTQDIQKDAESSPKP